ncbi:MAG TPA: NAD-dependent epimerase/dehydratase family protein [Pseudolysinimonas sp.]|jgi:nucleoside-diphosphate-sugar epimerase
MNIVLTGSTGYIGSAVLKALLAHGHDVTALVRTEESAKKVVADRVTPVVGDLTDTRWLTDQLRTSEGAIHLATDDSGAALDDAVVTAVLAAYAGTEKPYVHTGGIWGWGRGEAIVETDPVDPPELVAWRTPIEKRVLAPGIRGSVVAPAVVYGYGTGIVAATVTSAPKNGGGLHLVGDGSQHWAVVHVDDLAELYVGVLEKAPGGDIYIGASGENPTVTELAEAYAGIGKVVAETPEQTRERLGEGFADAILLDQQAAGTTAKNLFSWKPSRPTVLELLRDGYPADR